MAAKVNTRFILGLVLAVAAALAVLGGVYVLKMRGDATRNYRRGVEAMNSGEYKNAIDQFGRALAKEPANPEYLQRMNEALSKIVPNTANEAAEYFTRSLGLAAHAALYNAKDADTHLALLKDLTLTARRVNDVRSWDSVIAAADSMHQQLDAGDPQRPLAKVYRGLAIARLASTKSDDEIQQALQELEQAAAQLGDNDLAWSAQIVARASWIQKMQVSGKSETSIAAQRDTLEKTAKQAIEHAPNGPETARAYLMYLAIRRGERNSPVTDEDLRAAAEHLVSVVPPNGDPALINDSVALLKFMPAPGREQAQTLLKNAIAANPLGYDHQMSLAHLQFEQDQLDEAEASSRVVLDAKALPVSMMARMLFGMRVEAASLIGDIEFRRLDRATDRAAQMQKLVAARDVLASLSANPETDLVVTRADAKIAFARQQFTEAAQKFESLVRDTNSRDPEMLAFSAISLQQVGQLGLAHERISSALALNPGSVAWMANKAELELRLGRVEDAARTIQLIPDQSMSEPRISQIVNAVRRAAAGGAAPATDDPVQAALNAAQESLQKNETENARAALLAALQDHAESTSLLTALALVEFRSGNRDAAQQYVDRGLKIRPDDPSLNQVSASMRFEDPVAALIEYQRAMIPNEKDRLVSTLVSLASTSTQQAQLAAQLEQRGEAELASKAQGIATRARDEAAKAADALTAIEPENPQLMDFRFGNALQSQDWAKGAEIAAIAKQRNLDAAGGLLYEGRLMLAQRKYRESIAALEAATDRLSFSAFAWRMLAMAYQQAGNFAQAERAFEQAYRCNPNDINGARAYIVLLQQRGDSSRALEILRSVHRLAPGDVGLREAWLDLEASVGDQALALRERMTLYLANKADRENSASLARLLATLEPNERTILDEAGQPKYSVQRWASMSLAEQDEMRRVARETWSNSANVIVNELAAAQGDDLRIAVLRATILRQKGDVLAGETAIRDFIARQEPSAQTEDMYIELGRYQAANNQFTDAVDSLRKAVALGGGKQREAEVSLGRLHMQLQQYTDAITVLQSALARQDDQTTRLQIVECMINLGRLDQAEKMLNESAASDGGSVVTMLLASIARERGEALVANRDSAGAERYFVQQRDLLARAEQQDPTNPLPRVVLAQSLLDEYNRTRRATLLDDALVALERADSIRPGIPQVSAMRVAIQRERGETSNAIAELQRGIAANPGDASLRTQLVQLQVDSGDVAGALQTIDSAIRVNPSAPANASWQEMRGDLIGQTTGDMKQVVQAYAAAYDLAPSTMMLRKLTLAMLADTPPDCKGVADRVEARLDALTIEPGLRDTYARALLCLGQREKAIEQLRLAYAAHKDAAKTATGRPEGLLSWFVALGAVFPGDQAGEADRLVRELAATGAGLDSVDLNGLARLWISSGPAGLSKAVELARQAVTQCPPDKMELLAVLNADLGDFLLASSDAQGAAKAYEEALRLNGDLWSPMNNLAFLKAEMLGDPAGAIPLAERLVQLAPRQANVLDTVGWVYYKNNDLEKAKRHLSDSVAILPAAETYVHLAEVLLKSGDGAGAEKQLKEAEKLGPSAETVTKIKALRDDIGKAG